MIIINLRFKKKGRKEGIKDRRRKEGRKVKRRKNLDESHQRNIFELDNKN